MWFEGIAWADAAAAAPAAGRQGLFDQHVEQPVVPLVLVVAVFYFLIIRPQTQRTEHQKLVKGLKRNDEVVTNGGIVGRVAEMDDNLVTLEIAPNVRVRIERAEIKGLSSYGKAQRKRKRTTRPSGRHTCAGQQDKSWKCKPKSDSDSGAADARRLFLYLHFSNGSGFTRLILAAALVVVSVLLLLPSFQLLPTAGVLRHDAEDSARPRPPGRHPSVARSEVAGRRRQCAQAPRRRSQSRARRQSKLDPGDVALNPGNRGGEAQERLRAHAVSRSDGQVVPRY